MKWPDLAPGSIGIMTTLGASLCCVLPLTLAGLGLSSGAFMMVTMQYRPVLYPLGLIGLAFAYFIYFRQKRACDLKACKMAGKRTNLVLLLSSTVLMGTITYVDFFLDSM